MKLKSQKILSFVFRAAVVFSLFATAASAQPVSNLAEEINTVSFPLDQEIDVPLIPEGKFSAVKGSASVDLDERGSSTVRLAVNNLPSVFDVGGSFAAYVLWAVLPDGSTQRVGELRPDDPKKVSGSQLKATVNVNTFGMLVTIEPHPLVRLPNRMIVLKSGLPLNKQGKAVKTGTVKCVFDEVDYRSALKQLTKKEEKERRRKPVVVIAAENAVMIARNADAETNSPELYNEADVSLKKLDAAWKRKMKEKEIELLAAQTIQLAVNAEKNSLDIQKQGIIIVKETNTAREISLLKESLAAEKSQTSRLSDSLASVTEHKENLQRNFDSRYSQNQQLKTDNERLENEVIGLKVEIEKLKAELLRANGKLNFSKELPVLEKFLKIFGTTRKEENALILSLGEELWLDVQSAEISREQVARYEPLFKKIAEMKYFQVTVFSSTNAADDLIGAQSFVETRARSLSDVLTQSGVEKTRIRTQAIVQSDPSKIKKTKAKAATSNRLEISLTLLD